MKQLALLTLGLLLIAFVGVLTWNSSHTNSAITYKGKPLEAWFYGPRTNFFSKRTTDTAEEAFKALGTNAFPFLLSVLMENRGNGPVYFKVYRSMPAWIQTRLPYPISGDDIRVFALNYLRNMHYFSHQQVQALAEMVPDFGNPRIKIRGLYLLESENQTDPAFLKLCRELLNDPHPGIQLAAAISLAQFAPVSDSGEPIVFPILLAALESKQTRRSNLDIGSYHFQQQPPGGSARPAGYLGVPFPQIQTLDDTLREKIIGAIERLEPQLSQDQKDRFRRAMKPANP